MSKVKYFEDRAAGRVSIFNVLSRAAPRAGTRPTGISWPRIPMIWSCGTWCGRRSFPSLLQC